MAWACNARGRHGVPVLAHVASAMPAVLQQPGCKPQVAANVLHAMSSARYMDTNTVQHILAWSTPRLQAFNDQECANMAWALARLDHCDSQFFTAVRGRLERYVCAVNQSLATDMTGAFQVDTDHGAALGLWCIDLRLHWAFKSHACIRNGREHQCPSTTPLGLGVT